MEKLRVEFVGFEDIVVGIVIASNVVEQDMIVKEIIVVKNIVEMEIMHWGIAIVEVDRMGYIHNYYSSNPFAKVDSDFEWGIKLVEYSML